jgi:hypothetical protein
MNRLIKCLIVITVVLASCSKVKLHEDRIESDYWKVKSFWVDGIDSTEHVIYPEILGYKFVIEDEDDEKFYRFHRIYEIAADGSETSFGHWGRRKKNKMFLGNEYKYEKTGPIYNKFYYEEFEIVKLKNDFMSYELNADGKNYKIEFER